MTGGPASRAKGAPLALFAVLLGGWIGGRAMWWDNPYAPAAPAERATDPAALAPAVQAAPTGLVPGSAGLGPFLLPAGDQPPRALRPASAPVPEGLPLGRARWGQGPQPAPMHNVPPPSGYSPVAPVAPPILAQPAPAPGPVPAPLRLDRWSADAWAFARQGSGAAPISQGRVPIYGASQIGAIAQYRAAPQLASDPRLYARAYRALVSRGETEFSLGGSLRPVRAVPVRVFAELRYTQTPFADDVRPAVFLVSELPPQTLPGALQFEAYGQAGWVGGNFATAFADGQASVVREIVRFENIGPMPLRLSAGAGAWGGAQQGASRLDAGPTLRLEGAIGRVPARLSIDWRQQVGGDAAPQSGLAATLSTSF